MKRKHLTYDDLAKLVAGTDDGRTAAAAADHLEECDDCRERFHELQRLFSPESPADMRPRDVLRRRVMDSYDRIAAEASQAPAAPGGRPGIRRIAYASALAAVLLVSLALHFLLGPSPPRAAEITVLQTRGLVTADGGPLTAGMKVREDSVVLLAGDSIVRMRVGSAADLVLAGPGTMEIERSRMDRGGGRLVLGIHIAQGELLSRIHAGEGTVQCRYRSREAIVRSLSTEYLVRASAGKTTVVVISGRVEVESVASGQRRLLGAARKGTVTSGIAVAAAEAGELLRARALGSAMEGVHTDGVMRHGERSGAGVVSGVDGSSSQKTESGSAIEKKDTSPKADTAVDTEEGRAIRREMKEFRRHRSEMKRSLQRGNRGNR
ncbi:MAG: hypothetical protein JXA20_09545 [Spirochaetes bacterium]|nr:hypothetical protein [Spirochaetota bacterium]